jgi:hypothetical protein
VLAKVEKDFFSARENVLVEEFPVYSRKLCSRIHYWRNIFVKELCAREELKKDSLRKSGFASRVK